MPPSTDFTDRLDRIRHELGKLKAELFSLRGEAEFEQLPDEVVSLIARKAGQVGHVREDVGAVPKRIEEAEQKREASRR